MNQTYGEFSADGKEYIVARPDTPRNWYNYFWNDSYISFASQAAAGEGFVQDDMGRRLALVDRRAVYLIDRQAPGSLWYAAGPVDGDVISSYRCVHGNGYTIIEVERDGIFSRLRLFVPVRGNAEIWSLTLENRDERPREVGIFSALSPGLDGPYRPQGYNTAVGYYDPQAQAAVCRSFGAFGSAGARAVYGYLAAGTAPAGYDTRHTAFVGTYNSFLTPGAVLGGGCKNSDCVAEKVVLALENTAGLKPGQSATFHYVAGLGFSPEEIRRESQVFLEADAQFEKARAACEAEISGADIATPWPQLDHLFNNGLKRQAVMGSRWARVRHNGYRDMVSDSECTGVFNPDLGWARLKRALRYQYSSGYAPRTWLDGRLQDNNFADCAVWIPMAAYDLVMEQGDLSLLWQEVPYNDGTAGSVYEHAVRALDFLWDFRGLHGFIKIWGGDWNDMMNQAGLEGRGSSVWLSLAWCRAAGLWAEVARLCGRHGDADTLLERYREMAGLINTAGWDGAYYLDAFNDAEEKIGSKENEEGKIYLIPQVWAVFSGVAEEARAAQVMDAVENLLERDLGTLISWPAYHGYIPGIGQMTQKPPGVHENGGVYLHASIWKLAADCMMKRRDRVAMGLKKILPFDWEYAATYCEPYVMCNSYFTQETGYRHGTAGQSWRTASGAWLAKALVRYVYGLRPRLEGLRLNPCLPAGWEECRIEKVFRGCRYNITYRQPGDGPQNAMEITVDGRLLDGHVLPCEPGKVMDVRVTLK